MEFELDVDLIPINSDGWCEFHAVLLKDNEVIKKNAFELRSEIDTIYRGDNINPVYLDPGSYSMIIFPDRNFNDFNNTITMGMKSEDLYNDINSYHYQSSCAYYSFNLNLKSYDGSCYYIGCSDESAINFVDFVTQSDNSLCDYPTSEIFCGQSQDYINSPLNTSHYGSVHRSDNIFELQLEVQTTIRIQKSVPYRIFKENIYNLIIDNSIWDPVNDTIEVTLNPGKYLFHSDIRDWWSNYFSFVIDCLGCQDYVACNFNQQANISSDFCYYVENDCDYCLDGIIYSSDINNNNICDNEEIYGCNDSTAINFDISANVNDLSCEYYPINQNILLPSGWYMFSTYIDPSDTDISFVLDSINEKIEIVKE